MWGILLYNLFILAEAVILRQIVYYQYEAASIEDSEQVIQELLSLYTFFISSFKVWRLLKIDYWTLVK